MTEVSIIIENLQDIQNLNLKLIHINGQLDESNVDQKIQDVYQLFDSNGANMNIILDLENLEYMNSKSIGYFTDIYSRITQGGGKIMIAAAKPNIIDILQVVGLTQLIPCFDSVMEAKQQMAQQTTTVTNETATESTNVTNSPTPAATSETPVQTPITENTLSPEPAAPTTENQPIPTISNPTPISSPTVTPAPVSVVEATQPPSSPTITTPAPSEPVPAAPITEIQTPAPTAPVTMANEPLTAGQQTIQATPVSTNVSQPTVLEPAVPTPTTAETMPISNTTTTPVISQNPQTPTASPQEAAPQNTVNPNTTPSASTYQFGS